MMSGLGAAVALIAALTQCSSPDHQGIPEGAPEKNAASEVEVTADGFSVSAAGAIVSGMAGVASPGTPVRVRTAPAQLPPGWGEFARPLASGVDVRLGEGQQPQGEVTITFPGLTADDDVFVLSQSEDGKTSVLSPRGQGEVVVSSGHLSSFWPIVVNVSNLADTVFNAATDALQMTTPRPDCFNDAGDYPELGLRVSAVPDQVVWPCLKRTAAGVEMSLISNSPVAWRVRTQPAWNYSRPTAYSAANIVALAAWHTSSGSGATETVLLPGETVTLDTRKAPPNTTVGMLVDPVMSQVRTLAMGLGFLLPSRSVETISRAECLPDLLQSGVAENEPSATSFAAIFRCFGAAIGGGDGALVGLIANAPAALWTQLEGVMRSAFGRNEITFMVDTAEAAGRGRIDRAAIEPWLGEWTGPVDQAGARPYSVRLNLTHNGSTVVGTVEYPELSCSGTLGDAELNDDVLEMVETITIKGSCVATVDLELTLRHGEIAYYFHTSGSSGDGVLHRP
ncbi:hypothetical protein H7J08_15200 [Mycobacterium frederiksbergense]|uniref:hypothetical protein n=1 Tax=Mycolicibacterium frederiksbergense TaxID=117567 RepID=UPI0021F38E92|nr:hypothetical protein [Mycolicibacterium frederiksbergense]MCV7046003.1 hypothetical protein [Mycolicibacterium frederiksbergense]